MLAALAAAAGVQVVTAPPSSAIALGYQVVSQDIVMHAGYNRVTMTCPAGKVATGGGANRRDSNVGDNSAIEESGPAGTTGWTTVFLLKTPDYRNITFWAVCSTRRASTRSCTATTRSAPAAREGPGSSAQPRPEPSAEALWLPMPAAETRTR